MKTSSTQKRTVPPLDNRRLRDLALHYVGRYATTKSKLSNYLARKIRERGWADGEPRPDLDDMMQDFAKLGYVDDAAYAEARARSFARRGYGQRRLEKDLYAAGIEEDDSQNARAETAALTFESAHAFAKRKHIGPYANTLAEPQKRQKQLAAFIRAGHDFDLARRFVEAEPGSEIEQD